MKLLGCEASLPSKNGDLYAGSTSSYLRDAATNPSDLCVVYLIF